MAWVLGTSFDAYTDLTEVFDVVAALNSSTAPVPPVILPTAGRNGTPGLWMPGNGVNADYGYVQKNLGALDTYIVGASVCVPSGQLMNGGSALFSFLDPASGNVQTAIILSSNGSLIAVRPDIFGGHPANMDILGISSAAVSFNSPQYVEAKVKTSATVGTVALRINGVTVLNLTGQNTLGYYNLSALIGGLLIGNRSISTGLYYTYNGPTYFIDDLYICDTTGSLNNDFLGDVRGAVIYPDGTGNYTDLVGTVASWQSAVVMAVGQQIEESGTIQRVSAVTGDALTGGSPPAWDNTPGNTTTDNDVTWTCIGTTAAWMLVAENPPDTATPGGWTALTYVLPGKLIVDSNGNLQKVTAVVSFGRTGATQPSWSTTPGATTLDSLVTWTCLGTVAEWSYLTASAVGDKSTFTFGDLPSVTGTIAAVQVNLTANKTDGGPNVLHAMARSGGTDGESSDLSPSTGYSTLAGVFETDPDTASAWTPTGVNAAEFGAKKIS